MDLGPKNEAPELRERLQATWGSRVCARVKDPSFAEEEFIFWKRKEKGHGEFEYKKKTKALFHI